MTLHSIGLHAPSDRAEHPIETGTNYSTGMEYQVYESTQHEGVFIMAACHESVGLVHWFSTTNYADVERALYVEQGNYADDEI
jgi:hypothetical protein